MYRRFVNNFKNRSLKIFTILAILILVRTSEEAQARCYSLISHQEGPCPCNFACTSNGFDQTMGQTDASDDPVDDEIFTECGSGSNMGGVGSVGSGVETGTTDPVNLANGNFSYNCQGLQIPGRKLDINAMHIYSSGSSFNSFFGHGWTLNYYRRLHRMSNNDVVIVNGVNTKLKYIFDGSSYVPPAGHFEELVSNPDQSWTLTMVQGERYEFDSDGRLVTVKDRNGNTITLTYGAVKQPVYSFTAYSQDPSTPVVKSIDYPLLTITDTTGRAIQFNYNSKGLLETIIDSGRTFTFNYDPDSYDLLSITEPATAQFPGGVTKTFTYDSEHNIIAIEDAKNQTFVENVYDTQGRVEEQILGGYSIYLDYSVPGQTTETDRKGNIITYMFNADGLRTSKEIFTRGLRVVEPASFVSTYSYNANLLKTSETYTDGNGTVFVYDETNPDPRSRGNLLQVRRKADMSIPDDNLVDIVTNMTYEPLYNQLKTVTDPLGNITTNFYHYESNTPDPDYDANLVSVQLPAFDHPTLGTIAPGIDFTYNDYGQVTQKEDANGNIAQYTYEPATGYLESIIRDPAGVNAVTAFTYDTNGNIDTVTDSESRVTDYNYNELGWFTQVTNPRGYVTKYTHDANGNVIKEERQADDLATVWQTTESTYDVLNNLKTVTDPLGRVTTYNYDNNENLESTVDAELNAAAFVYDERDLLYTLTDANTPAGVTQYDYDLNGNLKTITDAKGNPTGYAYDGFDRLETTTYADATVETNVYDKNGNIIENQTAGGERIAYEYDALNRLTKKFYLPDAVNPESTFVYDAGSRLTDADNNTAQIDYVYDPLDRITQVTQVTGALSAATGYTYFKNGLLKSLTYPSGKVLEYTYDDNDNLSSIQYLGSSIASFTHDALDRRTTKSFLSMTLPLTAYDYDIANQLASITNTLVDTTPVSQYAYPNYDNVGNRQQLDKTLGINPTETITYGYNNIYELTLVTGAQTNSYTYDAVGNRELVDSLDTYTSNNLNQYTDVDLVTHSYDGNGNLMYDGTNMYTYDRENRLTDFNDTLTVASYTYDALNRRVSKAVDGATTLFVYDGDSVLEEYDSLGGLEAEYILGSSIDEVLTMERGSSTYYYHYDGLGSVTEITDSSGSLIEYYEYDPYGDATVFDETSTVIPAEAGIQNPYLFTGRRLDTETALYHYRARQYDPTIGRFLQRDPIGIEGGLNLYRYAINNPTNYIDPDGEFAIAAALALGYAAFEIGMSALDAYSTGSTLLDPCAGGVEKTASVGLFMIGALAPGGGYSTVSKTVGKGLKNVRNIRTGRLKGFVRGNTTLKGGNRAARKTFQRITGRQPKSSFDRVILPDNKEIIFRSTSKSGPSKIEIVDPIQEFLEKISFLE